MLEENVKLKNDKIVKISLLTTKDNFNIIATDEDGNIVGKCIFEICSRELKENAILGRKFLIVDKNINNGAISSLPINKLPNSMKNKVCKLCQIEILSDKFVGVGLGSLMLKKMEDFISTKGCQEIVGWFFAYGNFWYNSKDFYIKNGFSFVKDDRGATHIVKTLEMSKEK